MMTETKNRGTLITSHTFIKSLKILIAVLSLTAVTSVTIPVRSLAVRNQQIRQLNILEDSVTRLSDILMNILLESYTVRDYERLSKIVDDFMADYSRTREALAGHHTENYLEVLENHLNPRLTDMSSRLQDLENRGLLSGYMPLIERKYTVRNQGYQNIENVEGYVSLTETLDDLQFFLMNVIGSYRYELDSAITDIELLKNEAIWFINAEIVIVLIVLILTALLISANRMRKSRLSEEAALERSQNLEELVNARTADLEIRNRQMAETRDLLVEREKMAALGQVVSGVAHEVNTPLGVCVTAASFLKEKLESDPGGVPDREELREIARIIIKNISRAANLIQGFKKVAVDETSDTLRSFDLIPYLRDDLLPSLYPLLRKQGHEAVLDGPEMCMMRSYPGAIAQVITNLVLNASIHGYGETRSKTIEITIEQDADKVRIRVADQGVGMTREIESRIFEPFFTTNKARGGSGLGLMIVYNLVHARLEGRLSCRTSPGEGTEFNIFLPLEIAG